MLKSTFSLLRLQTKPWVFPNRTRSFATITQYFSNSGSELTSVDVQALNEKKGEYQLKFPFKGQILEIKYDEKMTLKDMVDMIK